MTAPKVIWLGTQVGTMDGVSFESDCWSASEDAEQDAAWTARHCYIRADAPELLALVGLLAEARTDLAAYVDADWPEHQRSNYPPIQAKWKRDMALCWQIDAAIAAWETIAPKPTTDALAELKG